MGEIVAAIGTCHTPYLFTNPPDENPEQLKQAATAMRELGKVLDETKPDVILFLGADHVETFSPTCIPTFCIIAGNKAIARFAGREIILPNQPRDGRGHPDTARDREELRHGVLGRRRARPRVRRAVRIRHRQARYPGHPVLHQRVRAAAADAAALRRVRQGAGRHRQEPQGARRDHRQRRHVALPRDHQVPASGIRFRPLDGLSVRGRQHRRAAQHDEPAARRGRQHRDAELGGHVRRDRRPARRADRLHSDLASRSVDDALPPTAGAQDRADEGRRAVRRIQVPEPGASRTTSTRRRRPTGSTSSSSRAATARSCAAGF